MRGGIRLVRTIGWVLLLAAPSLGLSAVEVDTALPRELQTAVSANLRKVKVAEGGYTTLNPGHGLAVRFREGGLTVSPLGKPAAANRAPAWRWGMKLTGYGTPSAIRPVAPATAVAAGQRLEYRRGAVTEWYENRPEGLEQGFTLAEPPAPGAEALVLSLAVDGGLKPQIASRSHAIEFRDGTGIPTLQYKDLKVVDATGQVLQAHFVLAAETVQIHVDARGAAWPVVVDPLVTSEQILAVSSKTANAQIGWSVALSGDTALVGMPYADPGSVTDSGRVYVYTRTGATWTEQQTLLASDMNRPGF